MIRAGDLDRTITIERQSAQTIGKGRAVTAAGWSTFATVRAKLIEASAMDVLRNGGEIADKSRVFRIRWIDGLQMTDRVAYLGAHFAIKGVTEIGRRVALELRCEAAQ